MSQRISVRHALLPEELDFCRRYVAFGGNDPEEAYRRSHLVRGSGSIRGPASEAGWCDRGEDGLPFGEPLTTSEVKKRVKALLKKRHINDFIHELEQSGSEHARQNLVDAVVFGDPASQAKARDQILAQEDKLGFRDAVEQWAHIMCSIGTEVVVPLPNGTEASVPLARLMPEEIDCKAPEEARKKTAKALREFADVLEEGGPKLKFEEK